MIITYPKTFTDKYLYWLPKILRPETSREKHLRLMKMAMRNPKNWTHNKSNFDYKEIYCSEEVYEEFFKC